MAMARIVLLMIKRILNLENLTLHICLGLRRQEGWGLPLSMFCRLLCLVVGMAPYSLGGYLIRSPRARARVAKFVVVLER